MHGTALFVAGLVVLIAGAELVVRGGGSLAASLGVKPLVIGLTVVAMGTSAPELAVGIAACVQGSGALAVGNIAGTNMVNILFILGLSAVLRPLPLHLRVLKLELPMMIAAAVLMTALAWDGFLSRLDGGIFLGASIPYTVALIHVSRRETRQSVQQLSKVLGVDASLNTRKDGSARAKYAMLLAMGIGLSVIGAGWLVGGAVRMARALGISETTIGITIVAIGTSAPELATTIFGTLKDERDIAVGNLLGSSIYNILVILGLTCFISPIAIPVETELLLVDIPLMTGVAILCIPVFLTGKRVSRLEGCLFVGMYLVYMATLVLFRS